MITSGTSYPAVQDRAAGEATVTPGVPGLEVSCLVKRYGRVLALDGCSLQVPPGQLVGLLGPNGAGKTTAMRTLFGLVVPDGGAVRWRGRPIDARRWQRFGYALAALMHELCERGTTVLFSSHQLDLVEHLCVDVVILDQGRVVLAGRLSELRAAAPGQLRSPF
jgi:ABC-type multidrug transport system ATPase subunit